MRTTLLLAVLVAAVCTVRLFRTPWSASGLAGEPESVESAVAARRLAEGRGLSFEVAGQALPPRTGSWFPAALAPAHLALPGEPGAGVLAVLAFSVAGCLSAFALGRRMAGDWGGVLAALAVACAPAFGAAAGSVRPEAPSAALLLLGACALARGWKHVEWRWLAASALCVVGAAALRPLCAWCALPIGLAGLHRGRAWAGIGALALPFAALVGATALWNFWWFGDPLRTARAFWGTWPDGGPLPGLSASFVPEGLRELASPWVAGIAAAGALGAWRVRMAHREASAPVLAFALLGAAPMSVQQLLSPPEGAAAHLPLLALLGVLAGAGVASLLPEKPWRAAMPLPAAIASLAALVGTPREAIPVRRIAADGLARAVPRGAVLVTGINPAYLGPFLAGRSGATIVPATREVAYARLRGPCGRPLAGPVADESIPAIERLARRGVPVLVDTSSVPPGSRAWMALTSRLRPSGASRRCAWAVRLRPPAGLASRPK